MVIKADVARRRYFKWMDQEWRKKRRPSPLNISNAQAEGSGTVNPA
jgi:hypothetical protein